MSNNNSNQSTWEDAAMRLSHQVSSETAKLQECEAQRDELLAFVRGIDEMIRMGRPSTHLWNYCVMNRESLLARTEGASI